MSLGRLVVAAVRTEGRTKSEVAREYGVSRQWVHTLLKRYDAEGRPGSSHGSERCGLRGGRAPGASPRA